MKRWRSEAVVALLGAIATVTVLQYLAWRELSELRLETAAAEQRLRRLAPVSTLGEAYDAGRKSLEMRLSVLESIEPLRWRLWAQPPRGSAGRSSGRDAGESRPDWGARLADLTAALSKGPAIESLRIEAGRLEVSFSTSPPDAVESQARRLRQQGLIGDFTISEPRDGTRILRAVLDESYTSAGDAR